MKVYTLSLAEALSPDQKLSVDSWEHKHPSFSDHAFGHPDKMHVSIPLKAPKSAHETEITEHLEKHGFKMHDYHQGLVIDKFGRTQKLGKALGKTNGAHLLEKYSTDPSRVAKDSIHGDHHVVISRHPYDVAGMTSRGHSWCDQSCMNFETGSNRHFLPEEVKHGSHVAYLVHKDDHEIKSPVARIALKPFHGDGTDDIILRPENHTYGNAPDSFHHTVASWAEHHFPGKEDIYAKNPKVYDDSHSRYIFAGDEGHFQGITHKSNTVRRYAAASSKLSSNVVHKYVTGYGLTADDHEITHDVLQHRNLGGHTVRALADMARDGDRAAARHIEHVTRYAHHAVSSDTANEIYNHLSNGGRLLDSATAINAGRLDNLPGHAITSLVDAGHHLSVLHLPNLPGHLVDGIMHKLDTDPAHTDTHRVHAYRILAKNPSLTDVHANSIVSKIADSGKISTNVAYSTASSLLNTEHGYRHIDRLLATGRPSIHKAVVDSGKASPQVQEKILDHALTGTVGTPLHTPSVVDQVGERGDAYAHGHTISSLASSHNLNKASTDKLVDYASGRSHMLVERLLGSGNRNIGAQHLHKFMDGDYRLDDLVSHPAADDSIVTKAIHKDSNSFMYVPESLRKPEHYETLMDSFNGRRAIMDLGRAPDHIVDRMVNDHPKQMLHHIASSALSLSGDQMSKLAEHVQSSEHVVNLLRKGRRLLNDHSPESSKLADKLLSKHGLVSNDDASGVYKSVQDMIHPIHATSAHIDSMIDLQDKVHQSHPATYHHYSFLHNWLKHAPATVDHLKKLTDVVKHPHTGQDFVGAMLDHVNSNFSDADVENFHSHIMSKDVGSVWRHGLEHMEQVLPESRLAKIKK